MVHHLCVLLVLLLGQQTSSGPVPGDRSASFRDAHSCAHYYSWVRNEHYDTWELERKQCPDQLYFEPTLNVCKPADQLVIKCPKGSTISNDEPSAVANSRRVRQLLTRDKKHADLSDSNDDLKYSTDEGKAMSPSNPEESGGKKLPFRRHPGLSAKQGTKRRKNTGSRANKKKKKNWVAIFVRGCNNRLDDSPFDDDDDEQQDEQLEEDENENQTNDDVERPSGNQNGPHNQPNNGNGSNNGNQPNTNNGPNNGNEPHNNLNNELGDGSNENGSNPKPSGPTNENGLDERKKLSSNCTCNDSNQQSTTSKPDCNHHENLTASSTTPSSATPTTDPKLSGSTPENSPNVSTTSAPNEASPSTPSNKPTNSPIRDNSTNAPRPSPSATPQSTTPHSTTPHSTTRQPVTSARPNPTPKPSTAKPKPSRIVLIPLKIANPHNNKNSTGKVDEKEALRLFLADLKRRRPGLSKESERQLALLFKAKVRGNDEKAKEPVDRTADHVEPAMVRAKNGKEPDVKDLKLEKIEEELGVELNDAFNYYTNLADKSKTNPTGGRA